MATRKRGWVGLSGADHPKWKGGRYVDRDGYIRIYRPGHKWPRAGGYILEHVFIIENKIGRRIKKSEVVHHKDHDRQNNNIENLELMCRKDHGKEHGNKREFRRDELGRFK